MATLSEDERKTLDRFGAMMLVTTMTAGTADALSGDPAKTALANFVNGVRLALIDPTVARRLSDAAEYMITEEDSAPDEAFFAPIESAREAFARLDEATA